jgi:ribosomal protein L29
LRDVPDADLNGQLETLRRQLWQQRAKLAEGASQQTHLVRAMKRQIAQIQTVLREKRANR